MPQLVITRGLPASGKTTYAREWVAEDPAARVRANRDDLRASMFGRDGVLDYAGEQLVTAAQTGVVRAAILAGRSVIVDDTNLRLKFARAWADLARDLGAELHVQGFTDVPLDVCLERDGRRQREGRRHVGEDAIRSMHMKFLNGRSLPEVTPTDTPASIGPALYVPDESKPPAWLVDVDGTLALMGDRRGPFDWARVGLDAPNPAVIELVQGLRASDASEDYDMSVVIMSGRDEVCRMETMWWLKEHLGWFDLLLMRPHGDTRKDAVVKRELFDREVAHRFNVRGVIDDRTQVVEMWRAMGLMCAQVAPGDF